MKKIRFILAAMAVLALASCNEKEPGENGGNTDKQDNTPIELKASTNTPAMGQETQSDNVLDLTWNATTNKGTGARIEYSLLIDKKGGNFESAYEVSLGSNVTSYSFKAIDLNKILKDEFGYANDETAELDMCIYASIRSNEVDDVISNTVTINAKAFEPKATVLYLIGSSTEAGWDLSKAPAMTPIDGEDGGFTWSGELFKGELKFMVNTDGWVPSYGLGDTEGTLSYRDHMWEDANGNVVTDETVEHVDSADPKFIIPEQANYKIILNIDKMTISIEKTGGPKYFNMYVVGSAVEQPVKMFRSSYAFLQGVTLKSGQMHFSAEADDSGDKYFAKSDGQALSESGVSQTSGFSWSFTGEKLYHVSLYAKENKEAAYIVEFTPYETLYLIGSACSAVWDIANALPMTKKSTYVQEWTGTLNAGELKFTCDCSTDWFGAWYLATEVGKEPEGTAEKILFLDKARPETASMGIKELDQKWEIKEPGTYKITLDQQAETVIIVKQ